ncbi:MAG: lytic murein transglycosylase, partial [Paracoccaceae bacterium]
MSRNRTFDAWLKEFQDSHLGRYSSDFLDGVFSDINFLSEILEKDGNQAEMTLNTGQYIESLCSIDRLIKGQTAFTKWSDVLTKIEL